MNLQFAVANLLRRLGSLIGLVTIVSVSFQPLEARLTGDSLEITARLDGAVTEEVRALVDASTPVAIAYEIDRLFADDTRRTLVVRKVLRYDALEDSYRVSRHGAIRPGGDRAAAARRASSTVVADAARAETLLSQLVYETDRRGPRASGEDDPDGALAAVIIEARLEIPEVDDQALVRGLWAGKTPTAVYRIPEGAP